MAPIKNAALEAALSRVRLCKLLHYNPQTGEFTWRISTSNRAPVGARAGCYGEKGRNSRYVLLGIDGNLFLAHRVAWFYMTGGWPDEDVDHKDGNGWNNAWQNLREATHTQNMRNAKLRADNKTGVKGIVFYAGRGKPYRVWLDHKYIGCYATLEEAEAARERVASVSHGEFYRKE